MSLLPVPNSTAIKLIYAKQAIIVVNYMFKIINMIIYMQFYIYTDGERHYQIQHKQG